jgi:hypothetical protein
VLSDDSGNYVYIVNAKNEVERRKSRSERSAITA